MFEVKVYRDTIIRNCKFFSIVDVIEKLNVERNWMFMFPKNQQFLQYWKYRKNVMIPPNYEKFYNKTIVFNSEEELNKYNLTEKGCYCWFDEDDYILFEFPDEETAFYFKMKFC